MSHWEPALRSAAETGIYGPRSFVGYLREQGLDPGEYRTAAVSIDTRSQLPDRLAERDIMVLHLGRATDGPGARFALVRVPDRLGDFFIDEMAFRPHDRVTLDHTPEGADTLALGQEVQDMLEVYRSLPTFSEQGFVNFALSTGLVSRALDLDPVRTGLVPATAASSFDFAFEPHPDRPTLLHHTDGQVGIDTLVLTRRDGERVLVVVEARCGGRRKLAKHVVGYPALAAESLSVDVDRIVPVYLRARPTADGVRYSIYECSLPTAGDRPCLAGLQVVEDTHYEVRL
ncbi:DUF6997 domain-containing protein [Halobellus ruber]|uniref:DUF6997 domain-containing protein n=1 Tax=Halobellus ruber TaxID=2761102 RepID=A0A7J9SPE2_9EURY|nr:hypothetical protein [Halobellus ruber]MBB6647281.1 hypothetical protein [Halobellus ruber]